MSDRTWEQKLEALQAIGDCSLRMRAPGNWYVSHERVSVSESCFLVGSYGNGATPQGAVEDHWAQMTAPGPANGKQPYLVLEREPRRHVYWNGHMWRDLPIEKKVSP